MDFIGFIFHISDLAANLLCVVSGNLDTVSGFGRVANNLMEPVSILSGFVQSGCYAIGASFVFASIIKFFEHKKSPTMVPISTVIFLLINGLLLILLPFITTLAGAGSIQ